MGHGITVYEPEDNLKKGYDLLFTEIFRELVKNRWLTYQLFKRDFFALYKQSFAGFLWSFVLPLVSVCSFILLNRAGIFMIGDVGLPYPVYAITGMAFWQLFSVGLTSGTNSLAIAGYMITKINFSRKSLVLASAGQALLSFTIQFGMVVFLLVFYDIRPGPTILLAPLLVLPLLMLMLGLGFILSLLNGIMRDVGTCMSMGMTFLMFLTPVLYSKPSTGLLAQITALNPLYYLIASPRALVLTGGMPEPAGYIASVALSAAVFAAGLIVFHMTETRIAERL